MKHLKKLENLRYEKVIRKMPQDFQKLLGFKQTFFQLNKLHENFFNTQDEKLKFEESCKKIQKKIDESEKKKKHLKDACPHCNSTDNFQVNKYGKQHLCLDCRELLRTKNGNQIIQFKPTHTTVRLLEYKKQNSQFYIQEISIKSDLYIGQNIYKVTKTENNRVVFVPSQLNF